jgi:hypothetical protein
VGTQVFPLIVARFPTVIAGEQAIFLTESVICVGGALVVWGLVPERRGQLEDEDVKFGRYLKVHEW